MSVSTMLSRLLHSPRPWENLTTIVIAAGVVMLMQPLALVSLQLFLRNDPRRHGDVRHRQPLSGISHGADPGRTSQKAVLRLVAVQDSTLTVADGEFFVMLGPSAAARPRRSA